MSATCSARCARSSAASSRSNDVDFHVPRGSIVSLIGPNGAGKTTFFNMLTGVYKPTAGDVIFDGEDVAGKPPHAITNRGIGRTFQNIRLFKEMTSLENVLVGMHGHLKGGIVRTHRPHARAQARGAGGARVRACTCSPSAASAAGTTRTRGSLPYGDQRRLEVARALATKPKLLLLDEPTAGMNPQETAEFTAFVSKLRDEQKLTVLLIEHDMRRGDGRVRPGRRCSTTARGSPRGRRRTSSATRG